jgi:hypothetical protein
MVFILSFLKIIHPGIFFQFLLVKKMLKDYKTLTRYHDNTIFEKDLCYNPGTKILSRQKR